MTSAGPRSKVYVNGAATSLRVLKELGGLLVDTNGQHASLGLRDAAMQLAMVRRRGQLCICVCARVCRCV